MDFLLLLCPRFIRRHRKTSDSSDKVADSYQLNQVESSVLQHGHLEGQSTASGVQIQSGRQGNSSSGLSGRLHKRFSREAKDLHGRPRPPEKGPRISLFSFSSKYYTANRGPVTSHDLGSSLMSERGYDSDAQFINTPKQAIYTTEYPTYRLRGGQAMSPPRQPYHEIGMEPTREHNFGSKVDARALAIEVPFYHGETRESQSSWRPQDHPRPSPTLQDPSATFHNIDLGTPRGRAASPCPSLARGSPQEKVAPGSPLLRLQDAHRHHYPTLCRSPIPLADFEENQYYNYKQGQARSNYPSPTLQQQVYTTSVESLIGPPSSISVRKRCQRPQRELPPDPPSVHLGDTKISRTVVSPSNSTYILPQKHSFDEFQRVSSTETWSANRWRELATPTEDASEPRCEIHPANVLSPSYSRRNSFSSTSYGHYDGQTHNQPQPYSPSRKPYLATSGPNNIPQRGVLTTHNNEIPTLDTGYFDKSEVHKSRFIEQFESDRSVVSNKQDSRSDIVRDAASTRRVSVGWMSGGRRVGYGYTLIPADDDDVNEKQESSQYGLDSLVPEDTENNDPCTTGEKKDPENSARQNPEGKGRVGKNSPKPGDSAFDISNILHRVNQRWPGAGISLKARKMSDAASYDSAASLLGILTKKKNNQDELEEPEESMPPTNPWEFCSWVHPDQALGREPDLQKNSISSPQSAEERIVERLTTLRRKGTVWTNTHGRKVSVIARDLEKRAVAKLVTSAEQFPAIQRTATRVLGIKNPVRSNNLRDEYSSDKKGIVRKKGKQDPNQSIQGRKQEYVQNPGRSRSDTTDCDSFYEECLEEHSIHE